MRTGTLAEYSLRVEAAVSYVLSRLDEPPSPYEIADHAGFSRYHFGRVFSFAFGEPLGEFVRRLRLERAAWSLEHSDDSVTEIAFDAGYDSLEGFSRAFRSAYLGSPTEFRERPSRHEVSCPSQVHFWPDGRRSVPVLHRKGEQTMEARIETTTDRTVVCLRHIGPYHLIGPKFEQLFQWAGPNGVPIQGALGIWYDDPGTVSPHDLRSDACIVVPDGYSLPHDAPDTVRVDVLPGGEFAVGTHLGSYEGLGDAWARFCGQALPALGRKAGEGPSYEVYVNDCSKVPIEEVRTDLYVPLASP